MLVYMIMHADGIYVIDIDVHIYIHTYVLNSMVRC